MGARSTARNIATCDITIRAITCHPSSVGVAFSTSLNAVVRASAGQGFMAILKADQEREFPLIFKRSELLEDDCRKLAPFVIIISWRRNSSYWLPQLPKIHLFIGQSDAGAEIRKMTSAKPLWGGFRAPSPHSAVQGLRAMRGHHRRTRGEFGCAVTWLPGDFSGRTPMARKPPSERALQRRHDRYAARGPKCRNGHPWKDHAKFTYRGYRFCAVCARDRAEKRLATFTTGTCPQGHPRTRENVRISSQGSLYCFPCAQVRNAQPRPVKPSHVKLIFQRLHEGQTISSLFGRQGGGYNRGCCVIDRDALVQFMKLHPRVGKKIQALGDKNRAAVRVQIGEMNRKRAAPAILRNNGADAYAAIMEATARLWEGERGDIVSLMFLAVAEGRLLPRDAVRRLPEFVRQHRRQFGKFRSEGLAPASLDRLLFDDGTMTLRDTITTGLWQ